VLPDALETSAAAPGIVLRQPWRHRLRRPATSPKWISGGGDTVTREGRKKRATDRKGMDKREWIIPGIGLYVSHSVKSHFLAVSSTKSRFAVGQCVDALWSLQRFPDPLAGFLE